MRPGAYFINTSRGEVIHQNALIAAMHERGIRAGLDVYADEPKTGVAEFSSPIASEVGFCGTHHIALDRTGAEAIAAETVRIIQCFMDLGHVPNAVNIARHTPATSILTVRHRDRPGVLARILDAISVARINVQEMENVVFEGAEAAVASIHLEAAPSAEFLDALQGSEPEVIELTLTAIGERDGCRASDAARICKHHYVEIAAMRCHICEATDTASRRMADSSNRATWRS